MRRIDYIKAMTVRETARLIIRHNITDEYCSDDCGSENECPHELECCMKWLEEGDKEFKKKVWSDLDD